MQVVDTDSDARLRDEAIAVARKVCACDANASRQIKQMIHGGFGRDVDEGLREEARTALAAYEVMASKPAATRAGLASAFSRSSKL